MLFFFVKQHFPELFGLKSLRKLRIYTEKVPDSWGYISIYSIAPQPRRYRRDRMPYLVEFNKKSCFAAVKYLATEVPTLRKLAFAYTEAESGAQREIVMRVRRREDGSIGFSTKRSFLREDDDSEENPWNVLQDPSFVLDTNQWGRL